MEKKISSLEVRLKNDELLIGREQTPLNEALRDLASNFWADLILAAERARKLARWPMKIIAAGALLNFLLLLLATWNPHWCVSSAMTTVISVISVGSYAFGFLWLELITANEITSLRNQYAAERASAQGS